MVFWYRLAILQSHRYYPFFTTQLVKIKIPKYISKVERKVYVSEWSLVVPKWSDKLKGVCRKPNLRGTEIYWLSLFG